MREQDVSEKLLEDYDDVFADIANVFYFQGKPRITEESLESTKMRSQYKNQEDELHEQERDVGKFWKDGGLKIAYVAFENQTQAEKYMPLRVLSYDGAVYKEQLQNEKQKEKFPSVTLVLYFGMKHWRTPKSLKEVVAIPEGLEDYVNDYKIQVCEVAWLTEEQVAMFQSDFRIVADFFVQKRKNHDYVPSPQKIKHVDAVLKLLSVFAKDDSYREALVAIKEEKRSKPEDFQEEEGISMCEIVEKFVARGEKRGLELGMIQGISILIETCQDLNCSREETLLRVQEKYQLEGEKAEEYMLQYWLE